MIAIPTTEYVFNSTSERLSHMVVELTFADFGDATTLCGIVVTTADLLPEYDLCPICTTVELLTEARALPKGDPGDEIDSLVQRLADTVEQLAAHRNPNTRPSDGCTTPDLGTTEPKAKD